MLITEQQEDGRVKLNSCFFQTALMLGRSAGLSSKNNRINRLSSGNISGEDVGIIFPIPSVTQGEEL